MPSPRLRFVIGLAMVACGIVAILASVDIGPLRARDIRGPPWIAAVAGGVFALGGILAWAGESATRHPWLSGALAAFVLAGFVAIGNWIAFGAGPRACSGGFSGLGFLGYREAAEIECRVAFGLGALMLDGMLVWALGRGLRGLGFAGQLSAWIEKLGKAMLLLALAPLLLILFVVVIAKALFEGVVEYRRTGKWPRNKRFDARQAALTKDT